MVEYKMIRKASIRRQHDAPALRACVVGVRQLSATWIADNGECGSARASDETRSHLRVRSTRPIQSGGAAACFRRTRALSFGAFVR